MAFGDDDLQQKRSPLQLPQPLPQPDAMGGAPEDMDQESAPGPSSAPPGAVAGKMDTPIGPITPPHPEVVAKSGGLGGYLKGVVGRLPKALAIMESSYGNSAPLQAIEQEEARQQAAVQQQFQNTITAKREDRAQQLFGSQLENFRSEIAYRNVQKQMEEQKITEQHQLQTAREIIQNTASTPDDLQRAHLILQSFGVEKPEQDQYMTDYRTGQVVRVPKTGAVGPAQPVYTEQQVPNFVMAPDASGQPKPLVQRMPVMGKPNDPMPKDDVAETFRLGIQDGKYTNDNKGWLQAERDVALSKHVTDPSAQGNKNDARLDRSYQFHTGRLETLSKPIEDRLGRLANLQNSISANNPQADALIAPELLTAMAGGQGSGLRMNEAEIARIVGGRNAWQDIKSRVLRWQQDPSKPFLLTDEQRRQVQNLMNVVSQRASQQVQLLREAQSQIAMSDDPQEHKRIYADMRKKIDDIMLGAAQEPQQPSGPPKGADVVKMH